MRNSWLIISKASISGRSMSISTILRTIMIFRLIMRTGFQFVALIALKVFAALLANFTSISSFEPIFIASII